MSDTPHVRPAAAFRPGLRALSARFAGNERGATAIEFALVLAPFLAFVFGIITIGLHYLATNSIEKAVFDASRQIRTGQAQKANMTAEQFKTLVCNLAAPHIDCNALEIHMSSYDNWKDVTPPTCIDGANNNLASSGSGTDKIGDKAGGASKKVLVTACYDWKVAKYLPYLIHDNKGNRRTQSQLASGGMLLQATAIFQTEPYE